MNCSRRRNRRFPAKKLTLRRLRQNQTMYQAHLVLVVHVAGPEADKFVVSAMHSTIFVRLNHHQFANRTILNVFDRFIGGFSGAKSWNQGYGYGQSSGYYGANYDGLLQFHSIHMQTVCKHVQLCTIIQ